MMTAYREGLTLVTGQFSRGKSGPFLDADQESLEIIIARFDCTLSGLIFTLLQLALSFGPNRPRAAKNHNTISYQSMKARCEKSCAVNMCRFVG